MKVRVHEVGPRDGLQNEPEVVPTSAKLELIGRLVDAGHRDIEVTSFVRPRWIPQLADAVELVRQLPTAKGVRYWALVPNQRGYERAIESGIEHVATFLSASETHNQKNVNRTVRESMAGLRKVITAAVGEGIVVRSYISTVFGCPYEGDVPAQRSLALALDLLDAGASIIALGDTTGMGTPSQVERTLDALVEGGVPLERIAVHFHDTMGTALANAIVSLRRGVRTFDGSCGGLGGCPYAPGASGNLATEDLLHALAAEGADTGVDLTAACEAATMIESVLGRELPGRYHRYARAAGQRAVRSA